MDEQNALARIRLAAQVTRNSTPPHCQPITILILILAIGTVFVGMTMTIVAHWPGSVSVGFDPLSIPGPIILSIGGIAFIVGAILVCYYQGVERKKKGEKFVSFANTLSRVNLEMSHQSKRGSQLLEKEPLRKNVTSVSEDDDDNNEEMDTRHIQRDNKVQGQRVLEEVITTTMSTAGIDSLALPGNGEDGEHLPNPVRSKRQRNNSSSRTSKSLEKMAEEDEEHDDDDAGGDNDTKGAKGESKKLLLSPAIEGEKRPKTKKKKINANYSRDILETKKFKTDEEIHHHQRQHQHYQDQHELNEEEEAGNDDDRVQGLRVHVKAKTGTEVIIRHSSDETPPHVVKIRKSKKSSQS